MINIIIKDGLHCPVCGAPELDPATATPSGGYKDENTRWMIRPYKVDSWCQCLVCSGAYKKNEDETFTYTPDNHDAKKGWFEG